MAVLHIMDEHKNGKCNFKMVQGTRPPVKILTFSKVIFQTKIGPVGVQTKAANCFVMR